MLPVPLNRPDNPLAQPVDSNFYPAQRLPPRIDGIHHGAQGSQIVSKAINCMHSQERPRIGEVNVESGHQPFYFFPRAGQIGYQALAVSLGDQTPELRISRYQTERRLGLVEPALHHLADRMNKL